MLFIKKFQRCSQFIRYYPVNERLFSVNAQGKFNYIFIDFPFGYLHDDLKPFIDIVIYLKTPLDVCFARQVIRDYSYSQGESIIKWAHNYLNNVRPLFIEHEKMYQQVQTIF